MRSPHERSTPVPPLRRPRRARPLCPRRRSGESQPAGAVTQHPGAGGTVGLHPGGARQPRRGPHGPRPAGAGTRSAPAGRASRTAQRGEPVGQSRQRRATPGRRSLPAARLLPEALAGFSSAHPRVRVVLLIEDWQTLRQRLLDDAVELFVADIRELQGDPQLRIHRYASIPAYSSAAPAIRCCVW